MIALNELRIGNWVIGVFGDAFPIKIAKGFQIDNYSKHYNPIHLTNELLIKCGFESYNNPNNTPSVIYSLNEFKIVTSHLKDSDEIYYLREYYYAKGIKYLHQLQNLYFILRGKELEIQL